MMDYYTQTSIQETDATPNNRDAYYKQNAEEKKKARHKGV